MQKAFAPVVADAARRVGPWKWTVPLLKTLTMSFFQGELAEILRRCLPLTGTHRSVAFSGRMYAAAKYLWSSTWFIGNPLGVRTRSAHWVLPLGSESPFLEYLLRLSAEKPKELLVGDWNVCG